MKRTEKLLKDVKLGDLVCVEWLDASRSKVQTMQDMNEVGVSNGATIDLPVKSFGVYIGTFGSRAKHVVILASLWHYTQNYGQVDTTVVPLGVVEKITVISKNVLALNYIRLCQQAFMQGRCFHFLQRFRIRGRHFAEAK